MLVKCKRNELDGGLPNLFWVSQSCLLNLMMNLLMMKDVMRVVIIIKNNNMEDEE